ncbi:MAG: DEAD/DEAH box helicase [Thermodesulfovibrionales bacterium]|nr:DEAD/DEAH box helicase [Thermodesulfovibrionales bacterium]
MTIEDLKSFGADQRLIDAIKNTGVSVLYPPQEEALKKGLISTESSFIVSAPTASGKTLIAEILFLKVFFEEGGKILYLVPLRALARQKYDDFKKRYERLGMKVMQSTGDYDSADPWLERADLIIATNEKVDSLIRHHASWLGDIRLVVVDEIHLLGDRHRGPTLEIVLTRLRDSYPHIRILGLSATIKNASEIADWLKAELVESRWRPVPLKEGVYFNGAVLFNDGSIKWIERTSKIEVLDIALDTVKASGQVLIFVNTRRSAESLAEKCSESLRSRISESDSSILEKISMDVLSTGEPTRLSKRLAETLKGGAAFHHAGLLSEHRGLVEDAFREGKISILVSTTTLAMGLNLPSRTVIIKDWKRYESARGIEPIPVMEVKQMSGRAGRPGYDSYGQSIMIARSRSDERFIVENYIKGEPEAIESQLADESVLRVHILSSIAGLFTMKEDEIRNFLKNTFYGYQRDTEGIFRITKRIISFLKEQGLITETSGYLRPTPFGKRVSELYIDPLTGVILRDALKSPKPKRLISIIHIICHTPDMMNLAVKEREMDDMLNAYYKYEKELLIDTEEYPFEQVLSELKTALCLVDWIEEKTEDEISSKYSIGPGDLHTIVELAEWLLYCAEEIAKIFSLKHLLKPVSLLRLRMSYGIKEELLELITLKGIGRIRARSLYNAGFRTREHIKSSSLNELAKVSGIGLSIARSIKSQVE